MTVEDRNGPNGESQNGKAKSSKAQVVTQIARIIRKAGLDYDGWRYVSKKVRQRCQLGPVRRSKKLPRVLTAEQFRHFYDVVDRAEDVQHALMLRLLFFTGVRVSELCNMLVADVDLDACKIRITQGKGSKDRYVLFSRPFATTLRTHLGSSPHNRWIFQTRRASKFSTRRVQQIVQAYAAEAGVQATPHTFRHQAITWLTKNGIHDSAIQLISGHARRETLAIYQHVALDADLESKYQQAMRQIEL